MVVLGIVALLAGAGLLYAGSRSHARAAAVVGTATTGCGELAPLAAAVRTELGTDAFSRHVELVGKARPAPSGALTGPLSNAPVVWWRTKVEHQYWDEEWRTDSEGKKHRERVKRTETVAEQSSDGPFVLSDATGSVTVDPRGVPLDRPLETFDDFRAADAPTGWLGLSLRPRTDTIGYRYQEWAVPVDHDLYVLGEARAQGGDIVVGKPSGGKDLRVMISTRSEADIVASSKSGARWFTIAALVLGAVGVVLVVAGALA